MEVWGGCVIARLALGDGWVYAFGDNGFIKGDNLEHIDTYSEGNIMYLMELLRKAAG